MHDYAQVYVDQKLVGSLDRRLDQTELTLPAQPKAATLDVLVENTGRVNYSVAIRKERTGLTEPATLDGKVLHGWLMYSLPMTQPASMKFTAAPCLGPCFYQADMHVNGAADTYLNTSKLHKGQMWDGNHNLGRFWSVGPQFALYTPGPWLTQGQTTLTFFDLQGDGTETLSTATAPIYGEATGSREAQ